jgi:hypothetical protein
LVRKNPALLNAGRVGGKAKAEDKNALGCPLGRVYGTRPNIWVVVFAVGLQGIKTAQDLFTRLDGVVMVIMMMDMVTVECHVSNLGKCLVEQAGKAVRVRPHPSRHRKGAPRPCRMNPKSAHPIRNRRIITITI